MVMSEARFDIEPSTPVAPEKIAALTDYRMKFLSEYQLGVRVDRKGWRKDMHLIADYLKKISEAACEA
jgi:hypothetical protein